MTLVPIATETIPTTTQLSYVVPHSANMVKQPVCLTLPTHVPSLETVQLYLHPLFYSPRQALRASSTTRGSIIDIFHTPVDSVNLVTPWMNAHHQRHNSHDEPHSLAPTTLVRSLHARPQPLCRWPTTDYVGKARCPLSHTRPPLHLPFLLSSLLSPLLLRLAAPEKICMYV
ncbi:hypothetical protein E2C01_027532 [Portunus trituberculatus]|uniref:Uncharacterized protein n=1 Tax=Portunus trituberculatus TaxID=210409 RepID=A0A5B7EIZ3_PORTR|nr:hypothetical protein [Portunus trituberculatus]